MIMMDEKLFAQINNDAFLLGSVGLQGNTFSQTIGYLNQYVNQLDSKTLPEDILRLQQATNQLLEIEKELSALTFRPNSEKLKRLAENHPGIIVRCELPQVVDLFSVTLRSCSENGLGLTGTHPRLSHVW